MCCRTFRRGEMSDIVLMDGRGFGFVTYTDPQCAQSFLEVGDRKHSFSTDGTSVAHSFC